MKNETTDALPRDQDLDYLTDCCRGFAANVLDDFLQAAINDGLPFVMVWCPQRETIH